MFCSLKKKKNPWTQTSNKHIYTDVHIYSRVVKRRKKNSNSILQRATGLSYIFIDKCGTQSRNILSSSGGNMVLVILVGTGVRVMIDYSQTEFLLLI